MTYTGRIVCIGCSNIRLVYDLWKLTGQSPSGPEHNPNVVLSRLFCKQTDGQMWATPQLMVTPLTTNYLFVWRGTSNGTSFPLGPTCDIFSDQLNPSYDDFHTPNMTSFKWVFKIPTGMNKVDLIPCVYCISAVCCPTVTVCLGIFRIVSHPNFIAALFLSSQTHRRREADSHSGLVFLGKLQWSGFHLNTVTQLSGDRVGDMKGNH